MAMTTVQFRGEEREVEYRVYHDPSVNACDVDWHFVGRPENDPPLTTEEEQFVIDQILADDLDKWFCGDED